MIFEEILTQAEKVKATGDFLRNLDPGDMRQDRLHDFLDDVAGMMLKTAGEIEKLCKELEAEETKQTGEEGQA